MHSGGEYETQSLDAKFEMCGGTREAIAIRRTMSARQCSKAHGTRSASLFALKTPLQRSPLAATIPLPPALPLVVVIATALIVIRLKRLMLATRVVATCYSELKPGVRL